MCPSDSTSVFEKYNLRIYNKFIINNLKYITNINNNKKLLTFCNTNCTCPLFIPIEKKSVVVPNRRCEKIWPSDKGRKTISISVISEFRSRNSRGKMSPFVLSNLFEAFCRFSEILILLYDYEKMFRSVPRNFVVFDFRISQLKT